MTILKNKLALPLLILVTGLVATGIALFSASSHIQQHRLESLLYSIDQRAHAIQTVVNKDIQLIGSTANFYASTDPSQWGNFSAFADSVLNNTETLVAIEWMEATPKNQLAERIDRLASTFPGARLYSVVNQEVVVGPWALFDTHYVVTDIMPRTELNLTIIGFYSTQERFQQVLTQIQETGQPVVSDRLRLLQDGTGSDVEKNGVLIYYPVFKRDSDELLGVVIGCIRITDYFHTLLGTSDHNDSLYLRIVDTGYESTDNPVLFSDPDWFASEMVHVREVRLPNRTWELQFAARPRPFLQAYWIAIILGAAGLTITFTLAGLIYFLNHEHMIISRLLADRTRELKQIAFKDPLTGLANRRLFDSTLATEIQNQQPFGLLMLDVDNLKQINDQFGHSAGDAALKRIAHCLLQSVSPDDLIARTGGDEIAIICKSDGREPLQSLADRLSREISEISLESWPRISLTLSIGASVWDSKMDAPTFLDLVDGALYQAKSSGRNQAVIA